MKVFFSKVSGITSRFVRACVPAALVARRSFPATCNVVHQYRTLTTGTTCQAQEGVASQLHSQSVLEHHIGLNVFGKSAPLWRRNKVVCTIGPACDSEEKLHELIRNGMNVARLNFSHGTHDEHRARFNRIRKVAEEENRGLEVAIALDTKGAEIRTGSFLHNEPVTLEAGSAIAVTNDLKMAAASTKDLLYIDYPCLLEHLQKGNRILIADGTVDLCATEPGVMELDGASVKVWKCDVLCGGVLSGKNNVHLPGVDVALPDISEKDAADLEFAVELGFDMIFASFINSKNQVENIRKLLRAKQTELIAKTTGLPAGACNPFPIAVIAKVESVRGIRNIDEIVESADGVMVARGDMGVEIATEKLFLAQKVIISKCNVAPKPCICATQMLESMVVNPRPTRAEASDVANAVIDGADCVMLSGETAKGKFPIESLRMMCKIAVEAQNYVDDYQRFKEMLNLSRRIADPAARHSETIASAAVLTAFELGAQCILTTTISGRSIRMLAKYCPSCPIVAVCRSVRLARVLSLVKGVIPLFFDEYGDEDPLGDHVEWVKDFDIMVNRALNYIQQTGLLHREHVTTGERCIVLVTNTDMSRVFRGSMTIRYVTQGN